MACDASRRGFGGDLRVVDGVLSISGETFFTSTKSGSPNSRKNGITIAMADNVHPRWRKWFILLILTLLVLPPLVFAVWSWASLNFAYSKGERAGYVQKITKKGWLCKTWEGELAMANLPGTMPEIFDFTVRDEAVAQAIQQTIGQRVSLSYEEHVYLPSSCYGETGHFITAVHSVTDSVAPAPLPAASAPAPMTPAP